MSVFVMDSPEIRAARVGQTKAAVIPGFMPESIAPRMPFGSEEPTPCRRH
jgi:hypothetical protein